MAKVLNGLVTLVCLTVSVIAYFSSHVDTAVFFALLAMLNSDALDREFK